jgi:hypothetical protein
VRQKGWAENLCELSCGVAAEEIHLKETVAGGDEALREDEVVERCGADVRDAVGIALDCYRG